MVTTNLPDPPSARLEVRRREGEPWISPGFLLAEDSGVPARTRTDAS
jgi:hypothetical protein